LNTTQPLLLQALSQELREDPRQQSV
jgi:hypothetical protein